MRPNEVSGGGSAKALGVRRFPKIQLAGPAHGYVPVSVAWHLHHRDTRCSALPDRLQLVLVRWRLLVHTEVSGYYRRMRAHLIGCPLGDLLPEVQCNDTV